jgi:nucleotide-binding universal stress UspA family protein
MSAMHFARSLPMSRRRPLEAVFLTRCSVPCFQITPAIAQLADDLDLRLTLLHAFDPQRERRRDVETRLRSFFPEADSFRGCRRVAREGSVIDAVQHLGTEQAIDLLIAPPSDALQFPSLLPSLRAELLAQVGTLLWTASPAVLPAKLRRRPRNIACWLDYSAGEEGYVPALRVAARHAEALEAQLHILYVPPDIQEGTLRPPSVPLHADEVMASLSAHLPPDLARPEIWVDSGRLRPLPELLRRSDADLLVAGSEQAIARRFWGLGSQRLNPQLASAPCPILCVGQGGVRVPLWRRQPAAAVGTVAA